MCFLYWAPEYIYRIVTRESGSYKHLDISLLSMNRLFFFIFFFFLHEVSSEKKHRKRTIWIIKYIFKNYIVFCYIYIYFFFLSNFLIHLLLTFIRNISTFQNNQKKYIKLLFNYLKSYYFTKWVYFVLLIDFSILFVLFCWPFYSDVIKLFKMNS